MTYTIEISDYTKKPLPRRKAINYVVQAINEAPFDAPEIEGICYRAIITESGVNVSYVLPSGTVMGFSQLSFKEKQLKPDEDK